MKPRSLNTSWRILRVPAYVLGAFAVGFAVLVIGKLLFRAAPARAASSVLYPSFCLGGWAGTQNAAGVPQSDPSSPPAYDSDNSAFLGAGVASQIFCGYFSVTDKTNPPARVVIAFNWDMRDVPGQDSASTTSNPVAARSTDQQSYTSNQDYLVSPSTGFIVPVPTSTPEADVPAGTSTPQASASPASSDASSSAPVAPAASAPSSRDQSASAANAAAAAFGSVPPDATGTAADPPATTVVTPAAVPAPPSEAQPSSAPAPAQAPSSAPPAPSSPAPASSSDGTTSYLMPFLSLIAPVAHGSTDGDPSFTSDSAFLSVSYSTDGIRWTQIGTVGRDNWKGYRVAVPVASWDDVNHLQIQLNVIPTIDSKPDIYLESISAKADYSRTIAEALAAAADSAGDAADALVDKILAIAPDQPQKPDPARVYRKKLFVSQSGAVVPGRRSDIAVKPDAEGDSLVISGPCTKKYFVILVYRNKADYGKNPASYVANEARECDGGEFSYSLSSLSPDIRSGGYYLLTGEEDDTGTWTPVSGLFPIDIQASTTVDVVDPDSQ